MTARYQHEDLLQRDEVVAPPAPRACEDHTFEMPTSVYVAMALFFAGAVAVLATAFTAGMAVSYGIVFAFLVMFFAVPAVFVRASRGRTAAKALGWYEFRAKGIATPSGKTSAGEAAVLVLLLPFLILLWAISVATIAALV